MWLHSFASMPGGGSRALTSSAGSSLPVAAWSADAKPPFSAWSCSRARTASESAPVFRILFTCSSRRSRSSLAFSMYWSLAGPVCFSASRQFVEYQTVFQTSHLASPPSAISRILAGSLTFFTEPPSTAAFFTFSGSGATFSDQYFSKSACIFLPESLCLHSCQFSVFISQYSSPFLKVAPSMLCSQTAFAARRIASIMLSQRLASSSVGGLMVSTSSGSRGSPSLALAAAARPAKRAWSRRRCTLWSSRAPVSFSALKCLPALSMSPFDFSRYCSQAAPLKLSPRSEFAAPQTAFQTSHFPSSASAIWCAIEGSLPLEAVVSAQTLMGLLFLW
mmetsp:Transcript_44122/g.127617  ORF Transcript_44122/g.127617 Transcript_44122/m.127617 type:complete len:334 (-) Transcript_44122:2038-3039(-)